MERKTMKFHSNVLSSEIKKNPQLSLFAAQPNPVPIGNHGTVRCVLGDFVEELTSQLFQGVRHKTDSMSWYCPDVRVKDWYFECKCVGRTKQALIYEGRYQKDRVFAKDNNLAYCLWHHWTDTKDPGIATEDDLRAAFLLNMKAIYIVPFDRIAELCSQAAPMILNTDYGGKNKHFYGSGYRIAIRDLEEYKYSFTLSDQLFI